MATYYVDPALGNDGNAGTSEGAGNAWLTLQYALDNTVSLDEIYVKNSAIIDVSSVIDIDQSQGSRQVKGYSSVISDDGIVT